MRDRLVGDANDDERRPEVVNVWRIAGERECKMPPLAQILYGRGITLSVALYERTAEELSEFIYGGQGECRAALCKLAAR